MDGTCPADLNVLVKLALGGIVGVGVVGAAYFNRGDTRGEGSTTSTVHAARPNRTRRSKSSHPLPISA
jgi:hypothetical protein